MSNFYGGLAVLGAGVLLFFFRDWILWLYYGNVESPKRRFLLGFAIFQSIVMVGAGIAVLISELLTR